MFPTDYHASRHWIIGRRWELIKSITAATYEAGLRDQQKQSQEPQKLSVENLRTPLKELTAMLQTPSWWGASSLPRLQESHPRTFIPCLHGLGQRASISLRWPINNSKVNRCSKRKRLLQSLPRPYKLKLVTTTDIAHTIFMMFVITACGQLAQTLQRSLQQRSPRLFQDKLRGCAAAMPL